jgi:hypothetical protein
MHKIKREREVKKATLFPLFYPIVFFQAPHNLFFLGWKLTLSSKKCIRSPSLLFIIQESAYLNTLQPCVARYLERQAHRRQKTTFLESHVTFLTTMLYIPHSSLG